MLHTEAVDASILELLKLLQSKEYLKGFYLAGGTALALYFGHRNSVDIDLFSNFNFDSAGILENINQDFQFQLFNSAPNTLTGSIGKIKVDIIAHRYPYIKDPNIHNDISILAEQDIVAMKLNAISTSGQRVKDFIDIYYLLDKFDLAEMLSYYKAKYNQQNETHVLKSLIYFDDVDRSDWPILIKDPQLKWSEIRKRIEKVVMLYTKK
ncbi:MAG: nucleotidyl transferase AbiEii/AbiGii toxin family protein [Bacteroidales bacterium]|nr:nucleotidyl transferase AbiEii/AbiGii toxin family protein [Bacteroidales bacterium]